MKILNARVRWNERYVNDPEFELLVDRIPAIAELRFEQRATYNGVLYFAELDGYVSFFYHDHSDHRGFGGWTFPVTLKDGTQVTLHGPWSSNPSEMVRVGFPCSVDCGMTERLADFERGYTFMACHLLESYLPDVAKLAGVHLAPGSFGGLVPSLDPTRIVKPAAKEQS